MNFKILLLVLSGLLLLAFIFYLWPVPQKSFDEIFEGEEVVKIKLNEFRKSDLSSLQIGNTRWNYLSTGQGGQTLLFLHGMAGAYDIWWQPIENLKDSFHIISITLPAADNLESVGEGLIAIMEKEGIKKVNIIGSSMGGYIAQYMVNSYPDRIEKAVFANTFPPNAILKEEFAGMEKAFPFIPEWYIMRNFRQSIDQRVLPASDNSELLRAFLLEQYYGGMTKKQLGGRLNIVLEYFDLNREVAQQTIPKLIIESDNDPLVQSALRALMKQEYPEASVYTFKGKGHFPYMNDADNYTRVLLDFLN